MTASPNDVRFANDVCLRAHMGKHRIIASATSNIIFAKQMHHIAVGHRHAQRGAYHQGRLAALVSHHALACIFLWLDDIQHFVLMIYKAYALMIYTPSA